MKSQEILNNIQQLRRELAKLASKLEYNINTIEIAGLRFAKVNLGTDLKNQLGKYYNYDEALEACPDGWRLPTDEEYTQLIKRTTQEVVIREGIRGMLFTDKDTNVKMFLPIAGRRYYNSGAIENIGNNAYYWSSTRSSTYYSYTLYFGYNGSVYPSYAADSSFGFSVRCILQ